MKVAFEVLHEDGDEYLTPAQRMSLAKLAISQLLFQIKEELKLSPHTLHLLLETTSEKMARIGRGDEDWQGNDLAKAKREAARDELVGSKVKP